MPIYEYACEKCESEFEVEQQKRAAEKAFADLDAEEAKRMDQ